jgi:hypothetical protein
MRCSVNRMARELVYILNNSVTPHSFQAFDKVSASTRERYLSALQERTMTRPLSKSILSPSNASIRKDGNLTVTFQMIRFYINIVEKIRGG